MTAPTATQMRAAYSAAAGAVGGSGYTPADMAILLASKREIPIYKSLASLAITATAGKAAIRLPYAFTVTDVTGSLSTASTSGAVTVDVNDGGTTILSTKLTFDQDEKSASTAAAAEVISDTTIAADAEITVDVDGAGTGAYGLVVWLIGYRTS